MKKFSLSVFCVLASVCSSQAEKLPKAAKALTADEVKTFYVNHSSRWAESNAYFAADGSVKGVLGKRLGKGFYTGSWRIKGNRFCMTVSGFEINKKKRFKKITDCWKWWKADGRLWTLWSVRYNNKKPSKNDYFTGAEYLLVPGDHVSPRYHTLKREAGK